MADSDKFDLTEVLGNVPLSEETQEKDARMKKRAEKRAAQDREEQVKHDQCIWIRCT